jgi:hypothetical protein
MAEVATSRDLCKPPVRKIIVSLRVPEARKPFARSQTLLASAFSVASMLRNDHAAASKAVQ